MFAVCSLRVSSAIRASKSSNYPSTRPSSSFPFSLSPHPPWFESAQERKRESGFQDYTWTREMGDIFFFSGDERARKSRLKASVSNFYRRWRRIFYGRGQCKIKKRRLHPSDSADNKGGYARYRRLTPRTPYAPLHRRTLAHHPGCETTIWLSLLLMKGEIYFGGRFSLDAFHSARYRHPFSSFSFYTSHPLQILRIFLFAGHDASVNLKWPPSDPFHSLEWKLNEIGSPRIEAGDQRCLSLSLEFTLLWKWMNSPFRTFIELCITNNEISSVLDVREIIKIYESSSFFSFFVRTWICIFSKDPISTRRCNIFNKIRYEKSRVKESHESTVNRELNSSSDTINFPLDKRLRFGRSSSASPPKFCRLRQDWRGVAICQLFKCQVLSAPSFMPRHYCFMLCLPPHAVNYTRVADRERLKLILAFMSERVNLGRARVSREDRRRLMPARDTTGGRGAASKFISRGITSRTCPFARWDRYSPFLAQ